MKTLTTHRFLALLGVIAFAACDESAPTEPLFDDVLTAQEQVELAVLADAGAVDIAIELAATNTDVGMRRGHMRSADGNQFTTEARVRFANAQEALRAGEQRRALNEARQGRQMVVRAVEATGGMRAVASMVERMEDMALTASTSDDYDDGVMMGAELGQLAASARGAMNRGDTTAAGERAVFGEQRARRHRGRRGRRGDVGAEQAELAVAMGATAVGLADRLLDENGADDEQLRFLATAEEFLAKAREAFAEGEYARALHLAKIASWNGLKAVVLPELTIEEARAMVDLAKSLFAEARVAVGDTPTELEVHLLERAGRLIEIGEQQLTEGNHRGVGAAWQAAVISSYLIG
jgi:hypothetical protein